MNTVALTVATILFAGAGLWCLVAMAAMAYFAIGFTGRVGDAWGPLIFLAVAASAVFWVAYKLSPFAITLGAP